MKSSRRLGIVGVMLTAVLALGALGVTLVHAGQATNYTLNGNTPGWVGKAQNLGAADANQTIDLTVWLRLHNEGKLQQQLHDLYTPGSGSYHKWLGQSDFNASYSPTAQEVKSVSNFLQAHGFTIQSTAENNFYIHVTGTVAAAEKAFHVQINNYSYHGQNFRSNAADPSVNDPSGGNIANVTGLDNASDYHSFAQRPALSGGDGVSPNNAVIWQVLCGGFDTTKTLNINNGTTATYTGFVPCGYGAKQLQKAYGIDQLVARQGPDSRHRGCVRQPDDLAGCQRLFGGVWPAAVGAGAEF
ncbi:MAG: protease pro-enzyme activation domain-containing protein [Ktedonobacterales bacterium]